MKNKIMNGIIVLEILTLIGLGIYIFIDVKSDKKMDDVPEQNEKPNDKEEDIPKQDEVEEDEPLKIGNIIHLKDYKKEKIGEVYKIEKDGLIYVANKQGQIIEIGTDIFVYGDDFPGYYAIKKQNEDVYSLYYSDDFITNNQEGNTYKGGYSDKYVYFPIENEINSTSIFHEDSPCSGHSIISENYYLKNINETILWNSSNGKKLILNSDDEITTVITINDSINKYQDKYIDKYIVINSKNNDGSILYNKETLEREFEYKVNTLKIDGNQLIDNTEYFNFCKNDKCGVGDKNGNLIIPLEYTSTFILKNDLIVVSSGTPISNVKSNDYLINTKTTGNLFGIVNLKNEIIIPIMYEYLEIFDLENYIIAKKNGKYGVINYKNEVIIDFQYEKIENFEFNYGPGGFLLPIIRDNYFFINSDAYNLTTRKKVAEKMDNVNSFDFTENFVVYKKNGKVVVHSNKKQEKLMLTKELNGFISKYDIGKITTLYFRNNIRSWCGAMTGMCMPHLIEIEDKLIISMFDEDDNYTSYSIDHDGNVREYDYHPCTNLSE